MENYTKLFPEFSSYISCDEIINNCKSACEKYLFRITNTLQEYLKKENVKQLEIIRKYKSATLVKVVDCSAKNDSGEEYLFFKCVFFIEFSDYQRRINYTLMLSCDNKIYLKKEKFNSTQFTGSMISDITEINYVCKMLDNTIIKNIQYLEETKKDGILTLYI